MKSTRPPKTTLRIALGHQARVGKDTFAALVGRHLRVTALAFSDTLYDVTEATQCALDQPIVKNPALLQLIGDGFRTIYGQDFWVERTMERVIARVNALPPPQVIIVTDMRYPNEMAALRAAGFTCVKISRANRPIDRDPNHPSEVGLIDANFDYEITNDGSLREFEMAIDSLLTHLIGATYEN